MRGALVILLAMVCIGFVLYLIDLLYYRKKDAMAKGESGTISDAETPVAASATSDAPPEEPEAVDGGICCGTHVVCEKTNLSPLTGEVVYYDDEELDRFAGREAGDYTPEETEEFRDVLLTLLPEDVAGWSRSIQVRGIKLPTEVREELLMIVSELRGS